MEINRLLGDELAYELYIRGLPVPQTVNERRFSLRGAFRMERDGLASSIGICSFLDPTQELTICTAKLNELVGDMQHFNRENQDNEYKRISTRLCHLRLRLGRIPTPTSEMETEKRKLLTNVMQQMATLANMVEQSEEEANSNSQAEERNILDQDNPREASIIDERLPLIPELSSTQAVHERQEPLMSRDIAGRSSIVEGAEHLYNEIQGVRLQVQESNRGMLHLLHRDLPKTREHQQFHPIQENRRNIPEFQGNSFPLRRTDMLEPTHYRGNENRLVDLTSSSPPRFSTYLDLSRWKLQYDGESSVTNFLERLEELRLSRGVSHDKLLRSACELFTKDALLWYRTHHFSSWMELVNKLKQDFQPYNYEDELWEEIRRRTQGARERVIIYIAAMENLFNRLGNSRPEEATRVRMIQRNLLPYIQSQLTLHASQSIAELTRFARAVEETAVRTEKFCPPPTNYRCLLEPDLAYRRPPSSKSEVPRAAPVETPSINPVMCKKDEATASTSKELPKEVQAICWNCKEKGHRFRQCTQQKRIFCFRCGEPNTTAKACAACQKNDKRVQK